jgi:CBS domain-containing protein
MSREVLSVSPDTPLSEVIRTLVDNGVKRLVVADEKGRLLGMVDRDVILKALAGQSSPEV